MISTPSELAKQEILYVKSHDDYVIITTAGFTINCKNNYKVLQSISDNYNQLQILTINY